MRRLLTWRTLLAAEAFALGLACFIVAQPSAAVDGLADHGDGHAHVFGILHARVIATGIPGAGAVSEVGSFLTGSPIHDRAAFAAFAQPGQVLDPKRVLIASTSNFGAPLARPGEPEGSILSIDPQSDAVSVPASFAAAGGQASTLGGAVRLYAAQSPAFLNAIGNPGAVTAALPSASLPTGISLNSGNGRPWLSNAPNGATGDGTITVLDPQGLPLVGGPDPVAGGVFTGEVTNRNAASTHGLTSAALGNAILTKSSDLTGRAVFAAVEADGSVVQVHVQKGVDGLAPPGTVTPLDEITRDTAESAHPRVVARAGIVFNWAPTRNLFIADPQADRIVVLDVTDDGTLFHATPRTIKSWALDVPIDLAPTTREISAGNFSSNTTLGVGSDLYVLNRGSNSIARMSVDGDVQAVRVIDADVPGFRANGIAVSSDGQTIYVSATTPDRNGVLMAVPAFGQSDLSPAFIEQARAAGMGGNMTEIGTFLFSLNVTPSQGLGPFFNGQSCVDCHSSPSAGGMGLLSGQDEHLVGRIRHDGTFDPLIGRGGPVARAHSIAELGENCGVPTGIPAGANAISLRNAMTLRGNFLLDTIAAGDILANMSGQPSTVRGRVNRLADGRIGKFGWKADVPTLIEFMGEAFRNEMGLTNPVESRDEVSACGANQDSPELDALALQASAMFLHTLNPPAPTPACLASPGAALFQTTGCATCHTPTLPGPGARTPVSLYSDLLLHDMGPGLADALPQASALGSEWRTMPLWRASERGKFLHDGRAPSMTSAITAHGGQAQSARDAFLALDDASKQALLAFLGCI